MRWTLPGGADLRTRDDRAVNCRPGAAVTSRVHTRRVVVPPPPPPPPPRDWFRVVKHVLEVVVLVLGLIGGIVALFGGRK